jgi:hypothetical protein
VVYIYSSTSNIRRRKKKKKKKKVNSQAIPELSLSEWNGYVLSSGIVLEIVHIVSVIHVALWTIIDFLTQRGFFPCRSAS